MDFSLADARGEIFWLFFQFRVATCGECYSLKTDGVQVIARGLFEESEKIKLARGAQRHTLVQKKTRTKGYTRVPLGTPGYSGVALSTSGWPGVSRGAWGTQRATPGVPQGYPGVPRRFGLGRGVFPPLVFIPKLDLKTP